MRRFRTVRPGVTARIGQAACQRAAEKSPDEAGLLSKNCAEKVIKIKVFERRSATAGRCSRSDFGGVRRHVAETRQHTCLLSRMPIDLAGAQTRTHDEKRRIF